MTWPRWAWALLGGILAAAGALVFLLAGGRAEPAADPRAGGQATARALAAAEARQVAALRAVAASRTAEIQRVASTPEPDARTAALAELLNRRHREAPP